MAENNPNELAELLRELEQILATLKGTEDLEHRRLLLRKCANCLRESTATISSKNESPLLIVDLGLSFMIYW